MPRKLTPRKLTPRSTLDNLKREAKRWLRALQENDPAARARLERAYPAAPADPGLRDVQHALAREYGAAGWTELKQRVTAGASADSTHDDRVARFLELACADWRVGGSYNAIHSHAAERLLRRHPEIARADLRTAVVCGEVAEVERILAARPQAASEIGGPRSWPPLLYLCNARLPLADASDAALEIARLLLDRGADPNAYYPGGSPSIHYSALTCVAGRGEEQKPPHPRADALAALLLERGAEPYDAQLLYNVFADHASRPHLGDDIIRLLERIHDASAARGRRSDWDDPEWRMLDLGGYGHGAYYLLDAAIDGNHLGLAEWLLTHGASPNAPPPPPPPARPALYDAAVARGLTAMAELLARYGATPSAPPQGGEAAFIAASVRLDRPGAEAILREHPEYLRSPRAMLLAAAHDRADVARFLLDLGMSPDVESPSRERPLHMAAYQGAAGVAALLIERGAEVDYVSPAHGSTPLGAAVFGRQPRTIELLGRVSRDVWELTFLGDVERLREVLRAEPERAKVVAGGETPLSWLPDDEERATAVAQLLLDHGADPSARNARGLTAEDRARERGLDEAAELLRTRA